MSCPLLCKIPFPKAVDQVRGRAERRLPWDCEFRFRPITVARLWYVQPEEITHGDALINPTAVRDYLRLLFNRWDTGRVGRPAQQVNRRVVQQKTRRFAASNYARGWEGEIHLVVVLFVADAAGFAAPQWIYVAKKHSQRGGAPLGSTSSQESSMRGRCYDPEGTITLTSPLPTIFLDDVAK
jgi:hypothetical protein